MVVVVCVEFYFKVSVCVSVYLYTYVKWVSIYS